MRTSGRPSEQEDPEQPEKKKRGAGTERTGKARSFDSLRSHIYCLSSLFIFNVNDIQFGLV